MLIDKYYDTIDELMTKVKTTQRENCIAAGKLIADSVAKGGAVHIYDTGHIINSELVERGGGLMLYKALKYQFHIEDPVRPRDRSGVDTSTKGLAKYILRASNCMPGDVLIMGSVSGKSSNVIDLALAAKEFGMYVIAITSVEYSSQVPSDHSSGKRLFECADIVLDNCAPAAEAMMDVPGLDTKLCAASGISAAFLMWSVTTVVVEELLAKGIMPSVFKSHNYQDGPEFNQKKREVYAKFGY